MSGTRHIYIVRGISLLILSAFFAQQMALAAPATVVPARPASNQGLKVHFELPGSIAHIVDSYKAPNGIKTIFLFQDAHTNESGQINLSKALDLVLDYEKIRYVFTEAGVGDNSLTFLKKYGTPEIRKRVGLSYLRNGEIKGTEYLNFTSEHDFTLWGVEDTGLYKESLGAYRHIANQRGKYLTYLNRIEATLKIIKSKIYNPALLSFDDKYEKYIKEDISLTEYFYGLIRQAKDLNIERDVYPNLKAYEKLRKKESQIDFIKANAEQIKAIQSLPDEKRITLVDSARSLKSVSRLYIHSDDEGKAFYELLEEALKSSLGNKDTNPKKFYPELFKYFEYLNASRKLDAPTLLKEQLELEQKVFRTLAQSADEARLYEASWYLRALQDLFRLTMTSDQFERFQKQSGRTNIRLMAGFLNEKIMELASYYERVIFLEDGFEDVAKEAEKFYRLTYQRDLNFVKEIVEQMNRQDQDKSVLVTGGYHTPNLKQLLKQHNISYMAIAPNVYHSTDHDRYEKLLLGQDMNDALKAGAWGSVPSGKQAHALMLLDAMDSPAGQQIVYRIGIEVITSSERSGDSLDIALRAFASETQPGFTSPDTAWVFGSRPSIPNDVRQEAIRRVGYALQSFESIFSKVDPTRKIRSAVSDDLDVDQQGFGAVVRASPVGDNSESSIEFKISGRAEWVETLLKIERLLEHITRSIESGVNIDADIDVLKNLEDRVKEAVEAIPGTHGDLENDPNSGMTTITRISTDEEGNLVQTYEPLDEMGVWWHDDPMSDYEQECIHDENGIGLTVRQWREIFETLHDRMLRSISEARETLELHGQSRPWFRHQETNRILDADPIVKGFVQIGTLVKRQTLPTDHSARNIKRTWDGFDPTSIEHLTRFRRAIEDFNIFLEREGDALYRVTAPELFRRQLLRTHAFMRGDLTEPGTNQPAFAKDAYRKGLGRLTTMYRDAFKEFRKVRIPLMIATQSANVLPPKTVMSCHPLKIGAIATLVI